MTLKQEITSKGYDFSTLPRGFKEEINYIDILGKRIADSQEGLDENSTDEDRALIEQALVDMEDRKREFLADLKEWNESRKKAAEAAAPKKPKTAKKPADATSNDEPKPAEPKDDAELKDDAEPAPDKDSGGGIAGFVIGGLALLVTLGAVNYFRKR
jgi:hypothetical protein